MSHRTLSEKSSFLTIHLASLSHSSLFLKTMASVSSQRGETKRKNDVPAVDADPVLGHLVFALLKIVDDLWKPRARVSVGLIRQPETKTRTLRDLRQVSSLDVAG